MNNQSDYRTVINEKGFLVSTIVGISMYPLLRQRKDSVHIVKINKTLKKNDVILYQRDSGQYVLHRIIKIKNGNYIICGDNQWQKEYGITDEHIIGLMIGYYRKEKYHTVNSFGFKIYTFIIRLTRPIRRLRDYIKRVLRKIFKKRRP